MKKRILVIGAIGFVGRQVVRSLHRVSHSLTAAIRTHLSRGDAIDLTSGTQIRDFLDVGEAGARIASMVDSDRCGPVNICSGHGITVRALAESIADEYGRRDLLRFGARPDNLVDPPCVVGLP